MHEVKDSSIVKESNEIIKLENEESNTNFKLQHLNNPKMENHILGPSLSQCPISKNDTLYEVKDSSINMESIEINKPENKNNKNEFIEEKEENNNKEILEELSDSILQHSSNPKFEKHILGSTNPKLEKHLSQCAISKNDTLYEVKDSSINKESIEINIPENKNSKNEFIDEQEENNNKEIIKELSDSKLQHSSNPKFEKHILGYTNSKLEKHILGPFLLLNIQLAEKIPCMKLKTAALIRKSLKTLNQNIKKATLSLLMKKTKQ